MRQTANGGRSRIYKSSVSGRYNATGARDRMPGQSLSGRYVCEHNQASGTPRWQPVMVLLRRQARCRRRSACMVSWRHVAPPRLLLTTFRPSNEKCTSSLPKLSPRSWGRSLLGPWSCPAVWGFPHRVMAREGRGLDTWARGSGAPHASTAHRHLPLAPLRSLAPAALDLMDDTMLWRHSERFFHGWHDGVLNYCFVIAIHNDGLSMYYRRRCLWLGSQELPRRANEDGASDLGALWVGLSL